jgi:hypothetical protein
MNGPGFHFATANSWTAVSLPYKGGKLTMTALLPPIDAGTCALPSQARQYLQLLAVPDERVALFIARDNPPGGPHPPAPRAFSARLRREPGLTDHPSAALPPEATPKAYSRLLAEPIPDLLYPEPQ